RFLGHRKHLREILAYDNAALANFREQAAITSNLAAEKGLWRHAGDDMCSHSRKEGHQLLSLATRWRGDIKNPDWCARQAMRCDCCIDRTHCSHVRPMELGTEYRFNFLPRIIARLRLDLRYSWLWERIEIFDRLK